MKYLGVHRKPRRWLWLAILFIAVYPRLTSVAYGQSCGAITPQLTLQTTSGSLTFFQFTDWCFDADAGQSFEFSTCPPEGTSTGRTSIDIRTGDGLSSLPIEVGTAYCFYGIRLAWTATATGTYRVRVRGESSPAVNFTMGYRRVQAPPCAGQVTPTTDFDIVSGSIQPDEFRDYCFDGTVGRVYDFTTCTPGSATFDTIVEVRDRLGRMALAANDDFCDTQSYVSWRAIASAPFRVRVYGFGKASGDFDLAYRVTPQSPCDPIVPETGYLVVQDTIKSEDYQEFCLDAAAGQTYEFQTCSPGEAEFAAVLELRDDTGGAVLARSNVACGEQSRLLWTAAAQRVRLRVRGAAARDFGKFSLAYRRLSCIPIMPDRVYQLAIGLIERGEFADYCFQSTPGQVHEFQTCAPGSASFDAALDIRLFPGDSMIYGASTGCDDGIRLAWTTFTTGTYRLRVRGAQLREAGDFQVAYRLTEPSVPPCTLIAPEEVYQSASGRLIGYGAKAYCFDAGVNERFEITTCPPAGSSAFFSTLDVRNLADTTPLALLDRTLCASGQRVEFRAPYAGRFRVRLMNQSSSDGNFSMAYRRLLAKDAESSASNPP